MAKLDSTIVYGDLTTTGSLTIPNACIESTGAIYSGVPSLIVSDTSNRGTFLLESQTDTPTDFFMKVDGKLTWGISARQASSDHTLDFYGSQNGTSWSGPFLQLTTGGTMCVTGSVITNSTFFADSTNLKPVLICAGRYYSTYDCVGSQVRMMGMESGSANMNLGPIENTSANLRMYLGGGFKHTFASTGDVELKGNVTICGTATNVLRLYNSADNLNPFIEFYCTTGPTRIGYIRGCGTNNTMTMCNDGGGSLTIDNTNTCLFSCAAICIDGGNSASVVTAGAAYLKAGCNTSTGAGGPVFICGGNTSSTGSAGDVCIYAGCAGTGTDGDIFLRTNGNYSTVIVCGAGGIGNNYVGLYHYTTRRFLTCNDGAEVNGILRATTCGVAPDWVATSDCRLKTGILPIQSALSTVDALCGVYYCLCGDESCEKNIGLIAQDVEKVLPEVVSHTRPTEEDEKYGIIDDKLGLKYDKLTAVLIEAVKELKAQNIGLQNQINELKNK